MAIPKPFMMVGIKRRCIAKRLTLNKKQKKNTKERKKENSYSFHRQGRHAAFGCQIKLAGVLVERNALAWLPIQWYIKLWFSMILLSQFLSTVVIHWATLVRPIYVPICFCGSKLCNQGKENNWLHRGREGMALAWPSSSISTCSRSTFEFYFL